MSERFKHWYWGGPSGVGKTTLIKEVQRLDPSFQHVPTTQRLMEYMGIMGNYSALRAMDQKVVQTIYIDFLQNLLRKADHNLLIDSHYMIMIRGSIIDRTGFWIKWFQGLVLVTLPVDELHSRVIQDKERDRALFFDDSNPSQQRKLLANLVYANLDKFTQLAQELHSPALIMGNKANHLIQSAKQFLRFAKG